MSQFILRYRVTNSSGKLNRNNACLTCRHRKRKCDAVRPICGSCANSLRPQECEYEGDPTPKELEGRVSELEAQIQAALQIQTKSDQQRQLVKGKGKEKETSHSRIYIPSMAGPSVGIPLLGKDPDWWNSEDIPTALTDYLITVFLKHSPQFHFTPFVPSFLSRLYRYPPSHPSYPHSCLLNCAYLLAVFYLSSPASFGYLQTGSHWNPRDAEMAFLKKTRKALRRNLSMAENLLDFLITTNLLSTYLWFSMKHTEAIHEGNGALQFAVACNLHLMANPADLASLPPSILPPPTSAEEIDNRINAFWTSYLANRAASYLNGTPISCPDDCITTPFPSALGYSRNPDGANTLYALYNAEPFAIDARNDTMHGIKAKISGLWVKVRSLVRIAVEQGATDPRQTSSAYFSEFSTIDHVLTRLISSMPLVPPAPSSAYVSYDNAVTELAFLQTVMRSTLMNLHGPFAFADSKGVGAQDSHRKVMGAAEEIVAIAHSFEKIPEIYWHVAIQVGWGNACEAFQKETTRILERSDVAERPGIGGMLKKLGGDMGFLSKMMRRLMNVYPRLDSDLHVIDDLLAKHSNVVELYTAPPSQTADMDFQVLIRFVEEDGKDRLTE